MLPNCSLPLRFPNYVVLPLVARHPGIGSCRAFDQPRFAGRYGPSMKYGNNSAICPTGFRRQTGQISANTRSTLQTRASVRRRGASRVVLDAASIGIIGKETGKSPCDIPKPASLNQRKRAAIGDHSSPGECAYNRAPSKGFGFKQSSNTLCPEGIVPLGFSKCLTSLTTTIESGP